MPIIMSIQADPTALIIFSTVGKNKPFPYLIV